MSQPIAVLLAGNALRLLIILVYLAIGVAALMRRAQLGTATVPAVLGSSLLAIANIISLLSYFWQVTVMQQGRQALTQIATVLTLTNYVAQSLAVIGAVLLGFAIFGGRPTVRTDA